MNVLVFLNPNTQEPFTTSDVIAEHAGVQHHAVQQMIQKHEPDFRTFGVIALEMRKPPSGSKGGRPETIYHLNEQQATLLMTYLKNTEKVRQFKVELVRQFYAMRFELYKVQAAKAERHPVRVSMTDAIKALPESPHKHFRYGQFTDLAYKLALGKTARQIRKERGASKNAVASDYMTSEELTLVAEMENKIGVLIGVGLTYQEVKEKLSKTGKVVTMT